MRVTEAERVADGLRRVRAFRGADQVAFNAALMAGRIVSPLVPAPVCEPANDTQPSPPFSAA